MSTRISASYARSLGIVAAVTGKSSGGNDTLRDELLAQIKLAGLPAPRLEVRASDLGIATRQWRYDLGWTGRWLVGHTMVQWVLVEINGAIWIRGAHARGTGLERDYAKVNAAQLAGHVCLQCSGGQIKSGEALLWIEQALTRNSQ